MNSDAHTYLLLIIRITLFAVGPGGNFIATGKGVGKETELSSVNYKTKYACMT